MLKTKSVKNIASIYMYIKSWVCVRAYINLYTGIPVNIIIGRGLDDRDTIPVKERNFSFLHHVKAVYGTFPSPIPWMPILSQSFGGRNVKLTTQPSSGVQVFLRAFSPIPDTCSGREV
jgi:hypothetical protein